MADLRHEFINLLHKFRQQMVLHTGRRDAILELRVHGDIGLAMGIAPGTSENVEGVIVHCDRYVKVGDETIAADDLRRKAEQLMPMTDEELHARWASGERPRDIVDDIERRRG